MRIFHWEARTSEYHCIADGYILANDRAEAEEKLKEVPFHDKHEKVYLDTDDCGYDGCEVNGSGIAIRWED